MLKGSGRLAGTLPVSNPFPVFLMTRDLVMVFPVPTLEKLRLVGMLSTPRTPVPVTDTFSER
jgi:hypothetical protein